MCYYCAVLALNHIQYVSSCHREVPEEYGAALMDQLQNLRSETSHNYLQIVVVEISPWYITSINPALEMLYIQPSAQWKSKISGARLIVTTTSTCIRGKGRRGVGRVRPYLGVLALHAPHSPFASSRSSRVPVECRPILTLV